MRRKKNYHQQKKFLIRKQVLANIVGNVKRTEWRIYISILACKELKDTGSNYASQLEVILLCVANLMNCLHCCSTPYSSQAMKHNICIIFVWLFNIVFLLKCYRIHCKGLRNFTH